MSLILFFLSDEYYKFLSSQRSFDIYKRKMPKTIYTERQQKIWVKSHEGILKHA